MVASGPTLSIEGASATTPPRSTRASDGLKPAIPQNAAGTRIEPDVSVPIAQGTTPAATATAEPEDEPPGARAGSSGFGGVPKCGFSPSPEKASSLRLRLAHADEPGRGEPRHRRRVGGRGRQLAPQVRGRRRRRPRHVDEVLPRHGHAVERARRLPRPQPRRRRARLRPRPLRRQPREHRPRRRGPRQRRLALRLGVELARGQQPAGLERRPHAGYAAAATTGYSRRIS